MRSLGLLFSLAFLALLGLFAPQLRADDGRVTQIRLPKEDVTLFYVERNFFTVALRGKTAEVEGRKFYIGDGSVAAELSAHASEGIYFQGQKKLQGEKFKVGDTVILKPGYKKAGDLKPGDIYVILPGVTFKEPEKL